MGRFNQVTRITLILVCISILGTIMQLFAADQTAISRHALDRRLKTVNSKIRKTQELIKQTEIKRHYAKLDLNATQRKLAEAQNNVESNSAKLLRAKRELARINARLAASEKYLKRRMELLSGRLVDIYKGGDIAYVDVLLGSRDMRTYVSRGYYVRQVVSSDTRLIMDIKRVQQQIEADRRAQAAEVRRIASLQTQLVSQRNDVAALEYVKRARLNEIEHDRRLYERMLAELEAESQRIAELIRRIQTTPKGKARLNTPFAGDLDLPVSGRLTSRFGYRVHPITKVYSLHTGVDIACRSGTPIHAAADGEVIISGWMGAYGNTVVIDHGGSISTLYGHNSKLLVRVGQKVSKGQTIALAGSTGWSTGPHCHFEKRVNGKPVNPL